MSLEKIGIRMKYLLNVLLIILVCLVLDNFNIVDFNKLLEIDNIIILDTLIPCTVVLLLINTLAAIRWIFIVNRLLGFNFDFIAGIALTYKSGLFAYFLPGQIGSELARVILATRGRSPKDLNYALSASIIDRVMALMSMLIMSIILLAWTLILRNYDMNLMFTLVGSLILIVIFVPACSKVLRLIVFALKKNRHVDYIGNIFKIIKIFLIAQPIYCIVLLFYSMFLNLAVAYVIYLIVSRITQPIDFSTIALMSLVSNLSAIIPITPGGLGISEIVFRETGALMQEISIENLAGSYIIFRLLNIFSYIFGILFIGLIRVVWKKENKKL